ncbi:TetR/AcrR family transcriptional regulator [Novosphingobium sp. KA1]|uniref:TetR/AcrR family transcriptional regulator n=1 Tax=Novosphingobium sp. (strain KA1) TaxID=164608 RepID=UPI001A900662|nr:TetR/AcrR family transcriptional regulator [Novosphingobium sp. KA1]
MEAPPPPSGARNAQATRARILDAAKQLFSTRGYSHSGIREIAARAGISSPLLLRYFGSKAGLFEAALDQAMTVDPLLAVAPEDFARHVTGELLGRAESVQPMLMIAMASGAPEAAEIAARVFARRCIAPLAEAIGGDSGAVKALQISILSIGFVFFLRHLPLTGFGENERRQVADWFTRCLEDLRG